MYIAKLSKGFLINTVRLVRIASTNNSEVILSLLSLSQIQYTINTIFLAQCRTYKLNSLSWHAYVPVSQKFNDTSQYVVLIGPCVSLYM